ncbi:MAG: AarF/ABC1/UbiB kinase family protein [Thermodesulfobacteriota bacterium]|nr:AarF/ABC1/UbiB kinase family protein [Thermodesulfobacteriota bacterium]
MNVFGFINLMRSIYSKKLPDLERIQDKGLLAVKIAQHFALRIDFLDERVCMHLSKLFTNARPVKGKKGKELIEKFIDKNWFDNFSSFEEIPFTAASIGQVHNGILKNGDSVVVKVIKEDFKEQFLKDLRSLRKLVRFLIRFYPKLRKVFNPLSILNHIEDYTISELDLKNEIKGGEKLQQIAEKYKDRYDLSKLKFPYYYKELSNSNVLVSKKIEGQTFDELLNKKQLTMQTLLELFHVHGLFLFAEGTFHGDIHPGNIIRGDDGCIYFIDNGALSSSNSKMTKGLFKFFTALSQYEYEKSSAYLNEMADVRIKGKQFNDYYQKFLVLYKDFKGKSVSEVSLTKKMMDTIKLGIHSGMEFDQSMFPIIKSLMYMDGMVLRCDPDIVLIEKMKAIIENFKRVIDYEAHT